MDCRLNIYNRIDACGYLSYLDFVLMIEGITMLNEGVRAVLIERIKQNGTLSRQDWILLANSVVWIEDAVITADTIAEWLLGACNLTRNQLVLFLENVEFECGEPPTIILTEEGNFVIRE